MIQIAMIQIMINKLSKGNQISLKGKTRHRLKVYNC
jgi:hypothetical protein